MLIQFNTDKSINGDQRHQEYFTNLIADELQKYSERISRIEVHISDENGAKAGINDIRCLIEARIEGRQPIAITNLANTMELSVSGAIRKLKGSLETILERSNEH